MSKNTNFNEKYDRQIRTFGIKATEKINTSNVYLYGLEGGLGTEIAKNLVLSGIKNLFLIDSNNLQNKITQQDIEFGYYYTQTDLNKSRTEVLSNHIQDLNPYCNVKILPSNWHIAMNGLSDNNNTIVICNKSFNEAVRINNFAREIKFKTIYVCAKGLGGFVFVDCLENHIVYDLNDEIYEPIEIINMLDDGKIFCNEHKFQVNDIIEFSNLKGTNLDFLIGKDFKVCNVNKNSFNISELNNETIPKLDFHLINGTVELVKQPKSFNHISLEKQLSISNSQYDIHGFDFDNSVNIINIFKDFLFLNNCDPWSDEINEYLDKVDEYYHPLIRSINIEIPPVTSILGGFASTEVIKLLTNKYTPISQFLTWNDFSICPKEKPDIDETTIIGKFFGKDFMNKMINSKVAMAGCGALGCEWLKNLSLLNIGTNDGFIDITDPDHIEISNLSRQFLFRTDDVKCSKSITAANSIKKSNSKMNINSFESKLSNENNQFSEKFFSGKTIVINALDNIEARKYVDSQCLLNNLPLFESGTMGMKGNTQPVIPFITETYSNTSDPEIEKEFAVCTIKNFPNSSHHTIHWARDYFELFNRGPSNLNKYFENPNFIKNLSIHEKNQAINDINLFLGSNNISGCSDILEWAKQIFIKEFNHNIKQLLHCFPKDHVVNNDLFWSNGKRCPKPLEYSDNIECIVDFIEATVHIICQCFDIYYEYTREEIKINILESEIPEFIVNKDLKIAKNDKELSKTSNTTEIKLLEDLNKNYNKFYPQEFEKDDDMNWHIAWINAASNCRALNYKIKVTSKFETKGIAGKIIPAVSTTTSTVVGLICFELLKFYNDCKNEDYQSWFVNMADNTSIYANPIEAPKIKVGNSLINSWTRFEFNKDVNLEDFINEFEELWKIKIEMILFDSTIIFSNFMSSDTKINIIKLFKQDYNIDLKNQKISLTIMADNESESLDEELPNIILNYN